MNVLYLSEVLGPEQGPKGQVPKMWELPGLSGQKPSLVIDSRHGEPHSFIDMQLGAECLRETY